MKETERAFQTLEYIISDYSAREKEASIKTKFVMLINKWESPYIACTELVKRIETNESELKKFCKSNGTTFKKIGYISVSGKAREILQKQQNK